LTIIAASSGAAAVLGCVQAFHFALTRTNEDPLQAAEDGPKTFINRLVAIVMGAVSGMIALLATQMVFVGRLIWVPFL
jgi:hypothetical protein